MRTGRGLYALGLLLASASFIFNASIVGKWYDRVGHVFINTRLWACVSIVQAWNGLTAAYFLFATRFRRSAKIDAVLLGFLCVLGFSATSASTAAGHPEFVQCAGYSQRCAMATVGLVFNWLSALYILILLVLKGRHVVSWPEDSVFSPTITGMGRLRFGRRAAEPKPRPRQLSGIV